MRYGLRRRWENTGAQPQHPTPDTQHPNRPRGRLGNIGLRQRCFATLRLLCCGLCLSAATAGARAQVVVKSDLVPRKEVEETIAPDPMKLSDIVRIQADADSKAGIERITFEVDDQFRFEAKQPPYLFDWDTLNENDGQHTIAITAYNVNGQTGVKRIKVNVENKLSLGIKHWVKDGLAAFGRSDLRTLDKDARKAFKISRIDVDSVRLMALNLGAKGDIGGGLRLLDDQQIGVPKEEAFTLRIRGYLALFQSVNQNNNVQMVQEMDKGFDLVRKQFNAELAEVTKTYPESSSDSAGQVARGDILFAQHAYEPALAAYEKAANLTQARSDKRRAQCRACMALLRLSRVAEAETLARRLNNSADATDTTQSLLAAALFQKRKYGEARETARPAAQSKNLVGLVVASLADLAMNDRQLGMKEAQQAFVIVDIPETQYALSAAMADNGNQDGAKRGFRSAFLRAPFFSQTLVERAWEIMTYETSEERFAQAGNILDLVLSTEPDNVSALAARAATLLQLKRYQTASPLVARLAGADPLAPDVALLKAMTTAKGDPSNAAIKPALEYATKTDPANFKEAFLPPMPTLIARLARLRRVVPLTPDLLDAADGLTQVAGL